MTTFNRTNFFSDVTTLEGHLAHAIIAYGQTTGGERFAEKSQTDNQPFCFYQTGEIFSTAFSTRRFMIARLGIMLDPLGAAQTDPLYKQVLEFPNPTALDGILKATS